MMNDCQNAEIRDQLPDLLHNRLTDGERAVVLAHVGECAECRDELELLRGVHQALVAATPRVNTLRIVSALPKPGESAVVPMIQSRPTRSRWADWRIAAAITVIAVGGGSFALLSRSNQSLTVPPVAVGPATSTPTPDSQIAPSVKTPTAAQEVAATDSDVREADLPVEEETAETGVGSAGRLNSLNEQQLKTLLNDIGKMKAIPVTEPDPINIKVDSKASSGISGDTEIM
jgi:hypothetical protein